MRRRNPGQGAAAACAFRAAVKYLREGPENPAHPGVRVFLGGVNHAEAGVGGGLCTGMMAAYVVTAYMMAA